MAGAVDETVAVPRSGDDLAAGVIDFIRVQSCPCCQPLIGEFHRPVARLADDFEHFGDLLGHGISRKRSPRDVCIDCIPGVPLRPDVEQYELPAADWRRTL